MNALGIPPARGAQRPGRWGGHSFQGGSAAPRRGRVGGLGGWGRPQTRPRLPARCAGHRRARRFRRCRCSLTKSEEEEELQAACCRRFCAGPAFVQQTPHVTDKETEAQRGTPGLAGSGLCCTAPRGAWGVDLVPACVNSGNTPLPVWATPTLRSGSPPWMGGRQGRYLWKDLIPVPAPRRLKAPPA